MSTPIISIIIPCYNAQNYLENALNSVFDQGVEDMEVIVVDDGSTDGTADILQGYSDRIYLKSINNQGAAFARNVGLEKSRGKYIKFLDADDYLLKGMLKRQLEIVQNYCSCGNQILFGGYRTDNLLDPVNYLHINHNLRTGDEISLDWLIWNQILITPPLHHRSLLVDIGGFNYKLRRGQEYDLHLRLALGGGKFIYHDDMVFHYRDHSRGDRISKGNVKGNAKYFYQILYNLISEQKKDSIVQKDKALVAAAQFSWKIGRSLIQHGDLCQAIDFFELSKSVGVKNNIYGGCIYKILLPLLGPLQSEKVGRLRAEVFLRKS